MSTRKQRRLTENERKILRYMLNNARTPQGEALGHTEGSIGAAWNIAPDATGPNRRDGRTFIGKILQRLTKYRTYPTLFTYEGRRIKSWYGPLLTAAPGYGRDRPYFLSTTPDVIYKWLADAGYGANGQVAKAAAGVDMLTRLTRLEREAQELRKELGF